MNMYLDTVSKLCAGVTSQNKGTLEFINKVATGWVDMATHHSLPLDANAETCDALQALAELIDNPAETEDNIEDFLGTPIAFGAFKECYPWADKYVIKFCAKKNPTLDEQSILLRAEQHHIDHFFVPSFYIQLPRLIDSQLLDKDDDESEVYDEETNTWGPNPDWEDNTAFTHICIQPLVAPLGDSDDNARAFSIHVKDWPRMMRTIPQLTGENAEDWYALSGTCLNWVADFAHYYGKTGLTALRDFCETFSIWDLHSENVGNLIPYVSGRGAPVILDWMSR